MLSLRSDWRTIISSKFCEYSADHCNDSISNYFLSFDELSNALSKLKCDKASSTFVKTEHIFHGSPKLALHLQTFFNGCIQHSYVPQDFLTGLVVPIVKNSSGDICSVGNYRGITLSSTFSHLFEHCLLGNLAITCILMIYSTALKGTTRAVVLYMS